MGEVSTICGAENGVCLNFRKPVLWVFIDTVIYIFPRFKGNHSTKSEKGIKYSQFGIKLERTYECEIPLIRNQAGRSVGHQEVVAGPLLGTRTDMWILSRTVPKSSMRKAFCC